MKRVLSLFLLCAGLPAQVAPARYFAVVAGTVAASGNLVLTIQQPTTGKNTFTLETITASCFGQAFTVAQSTNGVPATATPLTQTTTGTLASNVTGFASIPPTPQSIKSMAQIYTASNVGTGVATNMSLYYNVGSIAVINLGASTYNPYPVQLVPGTTQFQPNYTATMTNSGTGSCAGTLQINWREQ